MDPLGVVRRTLSCVNYVWSSRRCHVEDDALDLYFNELLLLEPDVGEKLPSAWPVLLRNDISALALRETGAIR
jgi:hypothetical protein